jgi:GTP cyclohydrolase II
MQLIQKNFMKMILLQKIETPLHTLLKQAQEENLIDVTYKEFTPKGESESTEEFVTRVQNMASTYQFVAVNDLEEEKFVAFGTPGPIIIEEGTFYTVPATVIDGKWGEHHLLFYPDVKTVLKQTHILLRIDSGCYSGPVLGDITCDCKQQLQAAQREIIKNGYGLLITVPSHDGRGWKEFKMANQILMQQAHMTTVEAALAFYKNAEDIDRREYSEIGTILKAVGFTEKNTFDLASNNQMKIKAILDAGLPVTETSTLTANDISDMAQKNVSSKHAAWGV